MAHTLELCGTGRERFELEGVEGVADVLEGGMAVLFAVLGAGLGSGFLLLFRFLGARDALFSQ